MEDQAVIKTLIGQGNKIIDRIGGLFRIQLGRHHSAVLHSNGCDGIFHVRHYRSFLSILILVPIANDSIGHRQNGLSTELHLLEYCIASLGVQLVRVNDPFLV